jgi:hypothetical protein
VAWLMAGAEIGAVAWWVRQDPAEYSVAQMARYCEDTLVLGLKQSLGWEANKEST